MILIFQTEEKRVILCLKVLQGVKGPKPFTSSEKLKLDEFNKAMWHALIMEVRLRVTLLS